MLLHDGGNLGSAQALSTNSNRVPKPELVVQTGHFIIYSIAFSPEGQLLASGGSDQTIKLWDVATGRELRTLTGHSDDVESVAFSPDGRTLASGSNDETIKLWDVVTGRELRTLTGHQGGVISISFSPDGQTIGSGSLDKTVKLWDTETGRVLHTLSGHKDLVECIAFGRNGRTLASGSFDKTIKVWDVGSGRELHEFLTSDWVTSVAFSLDGSILGAATGHTVQLWDLPNGRVLRTLRGHTALVESVAFSPNRTTLASGGGDSNIKLWDVDVGREVRTLVGDSIVRAVAFSPDGKILASAHDKHVITLWDAVTGRKLRTLTGRTAPISSVVFDPEGTRLALGSWDFTIKLWSLTHDGDIRTLAGHRDWVDSVAFSPDGKLLASGGDDEAVKLWNVVDGRELRTLKGTDWVTCVAFAPSGHVLAWGTADNKIRLSDVTSGRTLRILKGHFDGEEWPTRVSVAFSPDGRMLASGTHTTAGTDETTVFWNAATGRKLRTLSDTDSVASVAFSPDGRTLASAIDSDTDSIKLWNVSTGSRLRSLDQSYSATSVTFSPDGKHLASSSGEQTISLWDVGSGKQLHTLSGHSSGVNSVAFSPNGRVLASGSDDGSAGIWDAASGQELAKLLSISGTREWLVVTPDGLFDGSPTAWHQILWRFNGNTFEVAPLEVFFNEYFYPGLLADIAAGKRPKAPSDITAKDRRQPEIRLSVGSGQGSPGPIASRTTTIRLNVTGAPRDKDHAEGGVQDVRLFRNGSLVKFWHGDALRGKSSAVLEATVTLAAGENQFTAYAFNHDNIKSSDATLTVTGADSLKRKGTAYILAVGVDHYANKSFDLRYAVGDAQLFAEELKTQQQKLGNFNNVEIVSLLDEQATRANIVAAFARLAGREHSPLPTGATSELPKLHPAQPEDAVFIYFAGHGTADGDRFYLIPQDLGYTGERNAIDAASLQVIEEHSISDEELDKDFEGIDAGHMVLVIDACNSGRALEAEEKRRGPMNSKGLAQLAYEKGMYILTASQAYQLAQEDSTMKDDKGEGHGLLTYALVQEGLVQGKAAKSENVIAVRDWLDYAVQEVPQLQSKWLTSALNAHRGFKDADGNERIPTDPSQIGLQTPRVFYRREPEATPFLVGEKPEAPHSR